MLPLSPIKAIESVNLLFGESTGCPAGKITPEFLTPVAARCNAGKNTFYGF